MGSMSNRISEKLLYSPTNIRGCQVWFDGADPNGNGVIPVNGATVSTWVDKSGNARDATVAAGKIAGTYSTSNKAVNFAASNTGYATTYTANPSLETMFVVFNNPSPSGNNNMVIGGPQGARSLSGGYAGGGAGVGAVSYLNNEVTWSGMASMPAGTYTSGTTVIITGQVNGLTTSISQNGGTIYSNTTASAFSNVTTYLGTDYYYSGYYYIGYEMEVIFYNYLLSLAQRQQVEGYLAWKWGLQASLPSTHPYKNIAPSYPSNTVATTWTMYKSPLPPFLPTSVPGLTAWFDGSDPAGTGTPPSNGATISTWVDKSGSSHNAVAGVGPTFAAASLNGLGTITFNGSSTYLYASGLTVPTNTHSLFAVHNPVGTNATTQGGDTGILRAQETIGYIVFPYAYNGSVYGYTTSYISGYFGFGFQNDTAGAWNLYETVVGSSAVIQYQYGTVVTSNSGLTITATTSDNFTVGSYSSGGASQQQFYYGSMAEVLVFNVELSTVNRQKIEGYLAWKWGKQASLSPSHPYYSAAPTGTVPYSSITNSISVKYFTPLSIAGTQLWLDAVDPYANGVLPTNGASISTWKDKSGIGNNGTANTGVIWAASGMGPNLPGFTFTNSQWFLGNISITGATMTVFGILSMSSSSPFAARMIALAATGANDYNNPAYVGILRQSSNNMGPYRNGNYPSVTFGYSTPTLLSTWYDGANANISANGALTPSSSGSSGNFSISSYAVAANTNLGDIGAASFYGYISEIIVYNVSLTTAQRQTVEGYLAWKWGLQANLPTTHPFASYPPPP